MCCMNCQASPRDILALLPTCRAAARGPDFHDKYLLGRRIGRGTFAQVRVATKLPATQLLASWGDRNDELKREKAVKILDTNGEGKPDHKEAKVARKEAKVWAALGNHPNCVRLLDVFFSDNFCYMVMEKCSSGLLQALESLPELNERTLGNVFAQMLLGISHCHRAKIIHRDIKPDNFMVGGSSGNVVKLADFGFSTVVPQEGKVRGVFGTVPFMCPEMLKGEFYDEKADIWSFGVIVYVLMFGEYPYMPKKHTSAAMSRVIVEGRSSPNFQPASWAGNDNSLSAMRSAVALECVKSVIVRDQEKRPTADEILKTAWMSTAMQDNHMPGVELPSLRSMLRAAQRVGAFDARDPTRETTADVLLNVLQMERTGQPLPDVQNQIIADRRPSIPSGEKSKLVNKPRSNSSSWENLSGLFTAVEAGTFWGLAQTILALDLMQGKG